MDWRKILIAAAGVLAVAICLIWADRKIDRLTAERDRYKGNSEALLSDLEEYRILDSLNAVKVHSLELTIDEFKRFRAEDAALIKSLRTKNRDLASVLDVQSKTINELMAVPRDTVVIRDSIPVKAVAVHCGDEWYDFDGLLTETEFTGRLENRDSLVVAETVQYKRFLGFLWKTKKVKNREVDLLNKNPYTKIIGVQHIVTEK